MPKAVAAPAAAAMGRLLSSDYDEPASFRHGRWTVVAFAGYGKRWRQLHAHRIRSELKDKEQMALEIGKRLRDAIGADIRRTSWLATAYQLNVPAPTDRRIVVSRLDAPDTEIVINSKEQWLRLKRDQRAAVAAR
jgi:hypothetical protein